jgi:predicted GNAT family acetyltransferase
MVEVVHNRPQHRFELGIEGSDAFATAWYRDDADGHRVLTHTEVPAEFSGRGIGSRLARAVFDEARASGIKLVLKCPFMAAWFARHPEYGDVVAG